MAGESPSIELGDYRTKKVAIISAQWHPEICDALVAGATRALEQGKVKKVKVVRVPGSFELPLAAQLLLKKGYDAAVVVGLIVRGETPHFDYICQGVTKGVMDVSLSLSKPIGFGVLMTENLEQAHARAGFVDSFEDKGFDAAVAALKLMDI